MTQKTFFAALMLGFLFFFSSAVRASDDEEEHKSVPPPPSASQPAPSSAVNNSDPTLAEECRALAKLSAAFSERPDLASEGNRAKLALLQQVVGEKVTSLTQCKLIRFILEDETSVLSSGSLSVKDSMSIVGEDIGDLYLQAFERLCAKRAAEQRQAQKSAGTR